MYMKLTEPIMWVYISAYLKSQTSNSFFLLATWCQSWVPSTNPRNEPQFRALFWFLLTHNSKFIFAMYMKLSYTIVWVYVSAYFKTQTSIYFYLSPLYKTFMWLSPIMWNLSLYRKNKIRKEHKVNIVWLAWNFRILRRTLKL